MSFSEEVKRELCRIEPHDFWHMMAETYGLMLFSKNFNEESIMFLTENKMVAEKFADLSVKTVGAIVDIKTKLSFRDKGKSLYLLSIPDKSHRENILKLFHMTGDLKINKQNFYNEDCINDFLRGAFLSCGRISDPNMEYRLEFDVNNKNLVDGLVNIIKGLKNLHTKTNVVKRNKINVIYIKENEQICDFLTLIGANKSTMDFIQTKMVKEVRNYINRTTNFQAANIGKTAKASLLQIEAINNIKNKKGIRYLPDELRVVAELRLKNPELSLSELKEIFPDPISRSGLNHRLYKIIKISKNIDEQK